ncbi:MAG: Hint domain-containing protein, partial [Planctomycetota bacterium]|nr:Hint domain-containing protein [Planctomycetota bacterium]
DGTGGAVAVTATSPRVDPRDRAAALVGVASALVPAHVVPFSPLLLGLVGYFDQLARTYDRASSVLDGLAARIGGAQGGALDEEAKALEAALRALFPDLVAGIAEAFLQQVLRTAVLAPGLRAAGTGLRDLVAPFARPGAPGARLTFREVASKARELRKAGQSWDQIRRHFQEMGCFLAGTLVLTDQGPRPIEALAPGDRVVSRDPTTGAQGLRQVTRVLRGATTQVTEVVLRPRPRQTGRTQLHRQARGSDDDEGDDPAPLRSTPNHPIWRAGGGFVPAGLLRPGDVLRGDDGAPLVVERVVTCEETAPTWNLEVEGWHTYFVAGKAGAPAAWVHNMCAGGNGRSLYARAQEIVEARRAPNQTWYRTMSEAHFERLKATGRLPATGETFISPTRAFSDDYTGVLVRFTVKEGTYESLAKIGVRSAGPDAARLLPRMPPVRSGWPARNAQFKFEDPNVNIGLGRGPALDIFNDAILEFVELGRR